MKISIKFLGGGAWWQKKIRDNCERASNILSSPDFLKWVRAQPQFDMTHETPEQVADKIMTAAATTIFVDFWWNPLSKENAKEGENCVKFNTARGNSGAGSPGSCAHELMHALGYAHNGSAAKGLQNTVPWAIGNEVDRRTRAT